MVYKRYNRTMTKQTMATKNILKIFLLFFILLQCTVTVDGVLSTQAKKARALAKLAATTALKNADKAATLTKRVDVGKFFKRLKDGKDSAKRMRKLFETADAARVIAKKAKKASSKASRFLKHYTGFNYVKKNK